MCQLSATSAPRVFFQALHAADGHLADVERLRDRVASLADETETLRAQVAIREKASLILAQEVERLEEEIARLRGLLYDHDIDPDPEAIVTVDDILHTSSCYACGLRLIVRGTELTDEDRGAIGAFSDEHAYCDHEVAL